MHNRSRQARQFGVLYRIFLLRVVDLELLATDADTTRLVGQFATIFASVSLLFALPVLLLGGGHLSMTDRWVAEHLFLEMTMTVAGLVTVLNWDAAFPDRHDVLVLAPLPVRPGTLFAAKISALFAAPLLAMLGLNIFSGLVWPLLFGAAGGGALSGLRALLAYWATSALAGGFALCAVLTVQGMAANLLPRQVFLRVSAPLQAAAFCVLLTVFFLEPAMESPAALTAAENQRVLALLPSYWFLGLFQQLNGSMHPALAPLARRAWVWLAIAGLGALLTVLLSYLRMLPKIVEQSGIVPMARGLRWSPRMGGSLGGAVTAFGLRTLLRSRQHRTILSIYLGAGLAIAVGYGRSMVGQLALAKGEMPVTFLLAGMLLVVLTVLAVRVVAAIPIELRANWIFRVTQVRPAPRYHTAVRVSWMVSAAASALVILAAGVLAGYGGWRLLGHDSTMLLLGVLVVEVCLRGFRKIPFTCSYQPGKGRIQVAFWVGLMLLVRTVAETAKLESRMLGHALSTMAMLGVLAVAASGVRLLSGSREESGEELVFDDAAEGELLSLNLLPR